jgi:glycosyltransferase involved in cell wall biosynthesis
LRIVFYAPRSEYLDLNVPGGDPVMVHNLLEALRDRDHEVKIVSELDVRDFWRGRIPARRLVSEALSVRKTVREFSPDAWLVYTPSVTYPDLLGWWQRPKRYVLFAGDSGRANGLPWIWRYLYRFAHRRSLRRADAITVYRPASARHLASQGISPAQLKLMPPPPRTWDAMPSQEDARKRLGIPTDTPVALCLCRFPKPKPVRRGGKTELGLDLIQTVKSLAGNILLLLVGDDGPGQKPIADEIASHKLDGRVRLMGKEERIRLVGSTNNEDVKWFYAACDFYAYPHPLDRPWLSVLEAQSAGRPVVTLRTDSSELIVQHGQTGFLARDLEEFRSYMAALARDRARCELMGQAARHYIQTFHSMELRVRQIEDLLSGRN